MKIVPTKPFFPRLERQWILANFERILEGHGFLSQHKWCQIFEEQFAKYVGTKHALTVSNGTVALEAIFRSIGVDGAEVIVPTNTFAATAFAVIHAGGIPVFADIWQDFSVNPASVRNRITSKTAAIVTVHVGGIVSENVKKLQEIAFEHNFIPLIEDACHAHGSMLDGKKAGSFGDAAAFSFFSTKVMTTGEGGMITTNLDSIAEIVKLLRDQAKIRKGIYQNIHEVAGHNWRMTEVQALMGISQLRCLEDFIKRRAEIAKIYDEQLIDYRIPISNKCQPNWYKYIVTLPKGKNREKIRERLKAKDISLSGFVYELPLHQQPCFSQYVKERLPVAEDLCSRHICLPMYVEMSDEEATYVAKHVLKEVEK